MLTVEEGSLYPALQRMEVKGWLSSEWGLSENNRRARFYAITAEGRKRLEHEVSLFNEMVEAISRMLQEEG